MNKKRVLINSLIFLLLGSSNTSSAQESIHQSEQIVKSTNHDASSEIVYDELDYLAEHKEELEENENVPHWIKRFCMEFIIQCIAFSNYCKRSFNHVKRIVTQ